MSLHKCFTRTDLSSLILLHFSAVVPLNEIPRNIKTHVGDFRGFFKMLVTTLLKRLLFAGSCPRLQEEAYHPPSHTAAPDITQCPGGGQAEVHRHVIQVWPWSFPDIRGESCNLPQASGCLRIIAFRLFGFLCRSMACSLFM